MTAADIIHRCQLLSEGGWHPSVVTLSWWQDRGWQLEISINDNIEFGTPLAELPAVYELPIPYEPNAPTAGLNGPLPDGVSVSGWQRAADYVEPFAAPEGYEEQAAAVIRDLLAACDGRDGGDSGHTDTTGTPWAPYGRHRWHRCRLWRWESESMLEIRRRGDALKALNRPATPMPTRAAPVCIDARGMRVLRPCGCITTHRRAPGKGGDRSPSKRRFAEWLAQTPCYDHV